jgi:hypothetical protein
MSTTDSISDLMRQSQTPARCCASRPLSLTSATVAPPEAVSYATHTASEKNIASKANVYGHHRHLYHRRRL